MYKTTTKKHLTLCKDKSSPIRTTEIVSVSKGKKMQASQTKDNTTWCTTLQSELKGLSKIMNPI